MIDAEAMREAARVNDSVIAEHGGPSQAGNEALRDIGVDALSVMESAYEFAKRVIEKQPVMLDPLDDLMTAYTFGAITMARALKIAASANGEQDAA